MTKRRMPDLDKFNPPAPSLDDLAARRSQSDETQVYSFGGIAANSPVTITDPIPRTEPVGIVPIVPPVKRPIKKPKRGNLIPRPLPVPTRGD